MLPLKISVEQIIEDAQRWYFVAEMHYESRRVVQRWFTDPEYREDQAAKGVTNDEIRIEGEASQKAMEILIPIGHRLVLIADAWDILSDAIARYTQCLIGEGELTRELMRRSNLEAREVRDRAYAERARLQVYGVLPVGLDAAAAESSKLPPKTPTPPVQKTPAEVEAEDLEKKVTHVMIQHPEWPLKEIAAAAGCSPRHVQRMPAYQRMRNAMRVGRDAFPSGSKDGETGDLEAWEDADS